MENLPVIMLSDDDDVSVISISSGGDDSMDGSIISITSGADNVMEGSIVVISSDVENAVEGMLMLNPTEEGNVMEVVRTLEPNGGEVVLGAVQDLEPDEEEGEDPLRIEVKRESSESMDLDGTTAPNSPEDDPPSDDGGTEYTLPMSVESDTSGDEAAIVDHSAHCYNSGARYVPRPCWCCDLCHDTFASVVVGPCQIKICEACFRLPATTRCPSCRSERDFYVMVS